MISVLNFGAGVNSTALIIEMKNRNVLPDYTIFADTGSELPETYEHIEKMRSWFEENSISFVTVKSKYDKTLYDYYYDKKTIPWRKFRDCTDKFKKQPILKFVKKFKNEGVLQFLGIADEERHRIRKSDTKWIEFRYPLCEWRIDRQKCVKIIKKEGLFVPIKSGCFLCPFQPLEAWQNLYKTHPKLFKKARNIEEQSRSYPDNFLSFAKPLKHIENAIRLQKSLNEFGVKDICDGWCMT